MDQFPIPVQLPKLVESFQPSWGPWLPLNSVVVVAVVVVAVVVVAVEIAVACNSVG